MHVDIPAAVGVTILTNIANDLAIPVTEIDLLTTEWARYADQHARACASWVMTVGAQDRARDEAHATHVCTILAERESWPADAVASALAGLAEIRDLMTPECTCRTDMSWWHRDGCEAEKDGKRLDGV